MRKTISLGTVEIIQEPHNKLNNDQKKHESMLFVDFIKGHSSIEKQCTSLSSFSTFLGIVMIFEF